MRTIIYFIVFLNLLAFFVSDSYNRLFTFISEDWKKTGLFGVKANPPWDMIICSFTISYNVT